jgi:acyl carrier protein
MAEDVIGQLKHIIADDLDVNTAVEEIDETAPLFEDGIGLDSIAIMDFILLIEEHFGYQFSDTELTVDLFQNLETLAGLITAKVAGN